MAAYRLGRQALPVTNQSRFLKGLMALIQRASEAYSGVELPPETEVGPGLRIWHGAGLVVNPNARIGSNCLLRQGVTIGNLEAGGECPVIGSDVEIGAYAQILGPVQIGDGAKIGAMSVVLGDVPANATAVGVPARIVRE